MQQSGSHRGHPEALEGHLDALFETYKHTNSREWEAGEQQRLEVAGKVKELGARNHELTRRATQVQDTLGRRLAESRDQLMAARRRLTGLREETLELAPLNIPLLSLLGTIMAGLTVMLYLFYINTSYRAFFAQLGTLGGGAIGHEQLRALLGASGIFDATGLRPAAAAIYPLLFPFFPFALGLVLHLVAEGLIGSGAARTKQVAVVGLLLFTLAVDGLLAYKIHVNANLVRSLTGQAIEKWYGAADFYTVLCCGFGTALLWGAALHGLLTLLATRNPHRQREAQRLAYTADAAQAEAAALTLENELEAQLQALAAEQAANRYEVIRLEASLTQELVVVSFNGRLKLCLDAFFTGWVQFIVNTTLPGSAEPAQCRTVYERFLDRRFDRGSRRQASPDMVSLPGTAA
ncbi:hypothetical protein [Hymenobacter sp. IS2118]|uniref:hypothetical protein n=1 Tax=Hymenobacter sp. IS2118 TaxID=1505605 RepID=UPI000558240C|nr:hypothetical protein [Hymenobacter sp. IS2118]